MVLLVSGWLQVDGRPNRHWNRARSRLLSGLFAVARLMASRRCQNAPRTPRPRDVEGLDRKGVGEKGYRGLRDPRKESYLWNYSAIEIGR